MRSTFLENFSNPPSERPQHLQVTPLSLQLNDQSSFLSTLTTNNPYLQQILIGICLGMTLISVIIVLRYCRVDGKTVPSYIKSKPKSNFKNYPYSSFQIRSHKNQSSLENQANVSILKKGAHSHFHYNIHKNKTTPYSQYTHHRSQLQNHMSPYSKKFSFNINDERIQENYYPHHNEHRDQIRDEEWNYYQDGDKTYGNDGIARNEYRGYYKDEHEDLFELEEQNYKATGRNRRDNNQRQENQSKHGSSFLQQSQQYSPQKKSLKNSTQAMMNKLLSGGGNKAYPLQNESNISHTNHPYHNVKNTGLLYYDSQDLQNKQKRIKDEKNIEKAAFVLQTFKKPQVNQGKGSMKEPQIEQHHKMRKADQSQSQNQNQNRQQSTQQLQNNPNGYGNINSQSLKQTPTWNNKSLLGNTNTNNINFNTNPMSSTSSFNIPSGQPQNSNVNHNPILFADKMSEQQKNSSERLKNFADDQKKRVEKELTVPKKTQEPIKENQGVVVKDNQNKAQNKSMNENPKQDNRNPQLNQSSERQPNLNQSQSQPKPQILPFSSAPLNSSQYLEKIIQYSTKQHLNSNPSPNPSQKINLSNFAGARSSLQKTYQQAYSLINLLNTTNTEQVESFAKQLWNYLFINIIPKSVSKTGWQKIPPKTSQQTCEKPSLNTYIIKINMFRMMGYERVWLVFFGKMLKLLEWAWKREKSLAEQVAQQNNPSQAAFEKLDLIEIKYLQKDGEDIAVKYITRLDFISYFLFCLTTFDPLLITQYLYQSGNVSKKFYQEIKKYYDGQNHSFKWSYQEFWTLTDAILKNPLKEAYYRPIFYMNMMSATYLQMRKHKQNPTEMKQFNHIYQYVLKEGIAYTQPKNLKQNKQLKVLEKDVQREKFMFDGEAFTDQINNTKYLFTEKEKDKRKGLEEFQKKNSPFDFYKKGKN